MSKHNGAKPENVVIRELFDGAMVVTFRPRSVVQRVSARRFLREIQDSFEWPEDEEDRQEFEYLAENYAILRSGIASIVFDLTDAHAPALHWFQEQWARLDKLAPKEQLAIRCEMADEIWFAIVDAWNAQTIYIPLEQKPGPLLTDAERDERADPKATPMPATTTGSDSN